jgi:hypothetical protein
VVTNPTIGSNVEEIVYKNIKFVMWDIGGQQSLRTSWSNYFTGTNVRHKISFCAAPLWSRDLGLKFYTRMDIFFIIISHPPKPNQSFFVSVSALSNFNVCDLGYHFRD